MGENIENSKFPTNVIIYVLYSIKKVSEPF
jgi:hypothetical protein